MPYLISTKGGENPQSVLLVLFPLFLEIKMAEVRKLRANGLPTIPSTMGLEKKTNVFLRAMDARSFAEYRTAKDNF